MTTAALATAEEHYFQNVALTAKRVETNIGIIKDPGHDEPWIIAMSEKPGYLSTLDYSNRWGIEPMFSDFKSRGFGIEHTQIHYPERVAGLILVMALALYWAASTGMWDALHNPTTQLPAKKSPPHQPRKLARSRLSWFTRGLRRIMKLLLIAMPLPSLWGSLKTDGC